MTITLQKLSFDGKGINDMRAEYKPRIATFSESYGEEFGNLFAAAPELLEALTAMRSLDLAKLKDMAKQTGYSVDIFLAACKLADKAIAKAKGE